MKKRLNRRVLLLASMLLWAYLSWAQSSHQQGSSGSANKVDAQLVKTGLFLFSSNGANTLLRLTGNGLILVDGQPSPYCSNLRARIERISDQPIRALILTDNDASHVGCNQKLIDEHVRIVAQESLQESLKDALSGNPPPLTFDREYKLSLGGAEADLYYFGKAHTGGETAVYFPNLRVVAVGDLFADEPTPDFSNGGSLVGWASALSQLLKLDFDTVVPGHGPVRSRADLEAFKNRLDSLVSRASELVRAGVPKDGLMSQLQSSGLGWNASLTGQYLDKFYADLSGPQVISAEKQPPQ